MRAYADTSFLVKLLASENGSEEAMAEFRRLDFPQLFFLPLHALEVANAIRHRAFHLRHSVPAAERSVIGRERDAALGKVERWLKRGWLVDVNQDLEQAFLHAQKLSERHTERLGCRGFDLLHVALAIELACKEFFTSDRIQSSLARSEGLQVIVVADN
jgi:predicted nucleic acid-binding protein